MEIRRATERDAPAIRALIDLYIADGTLLPRTEEFIASHADHFVVAVRDDRVVGCAHLDEYAPSLAELRSLAVAPDGIGVSTSIDSSVLDEIASGSGVIPVTPLLFTMAQTTSGLPFAQPWGAITRA